MAKRTFTEANNGLLYCNLPTNFRVGSNALLWAYADLKSSAPTTGNKAVDPFAPVATENSTKKAKINSRQLFVYIEENLKQYGYAHSNDQDIASICSQLDEEDIENLSKMFPDLKEEFDAVFHNQESETEVAGVEVEI